MAEYKEIKGQTIQVLDTNPVVYAGTWSTGGALNDARDFKGTAGIQTASIAAGGRTTVNTELYNGTSWTEVNNLGTGRYMIAMAGTTSAALGSGGYFSGGGESGVNLVENWDGTSWSEIAELGTATYGAVTAGTNTAAIVYGGGNPAKTTNQQWNGTAWSIVFDASAQDSTVIYTSNLTTGKQYKYENAEWVLAYDGEYPRGSWRLAY